MPFLDLPNEVIVEILKLLDDIYAYIQLSSVSKKLQRLIKSLVLVIGDSPIQSNLFKSITGEFIHVCHNNAINQYEEIIKSYRYFIVELNRSYRDSSTNKLLIDEYVDTILRFKQNKPFKILRTFLTVESLELLVKTFANGSDLGFSDSLFQIDKTIIKLQDNSNKSFLPINHLDVLSHDYDIFDVEVLPRTYFHVNPLHDFTINSKSIKALSGIVSTTMTHPRLPPLLKFLEGSHIPNLQIISDISIEAGLSLKVFEHFTNLESLSIQSAFTGNIELQLSFAKRRIRLNKLHTLKIVGNAISLSSLSLPNLVNFSIELYGSTERTFAQSITLTNISCPNLASLHIEILSVEEGLHYIISQLKSSLQNLKKLSLVSNDKSFLSIFDSLNLRNLSHLTLKHNGVRIADLNYNMEDYSGVKLNCNLKLNINFKSFPLLKTLNILDFDRFNSSFINQNVKFPNLTTLLVTFKVSEEDQIYEIRDDCFPKLSKLCMKYANRFGPLKECNIEIKIHDLPCLEKVYYDPSLSITLPNERLRNLFVPLSGIPNDEPLDSDDFD